MPRTGRLMATAHGRIAVLRRRAASGALARSSDPPHRADA
ncbi:hypothetical protein LA76x_3199 [Lysobacter antibioticus]|uniref:Uncharacterized protein n=1 Tax=Lysobacter antibioticus TaxID=84531 RepID=A0A0S2FCP5_LYSAN|nr:hypothetical protein LA76x_3199 [Lysobacter antibioticus]